MYRHISFYCVLLCFTNIAFFMNWRFVVTLCQGLLAAFFQQHLVTSFFSLCYISEIFTVYQSILLLSYLLLWSVFIDLWCTIIIVLGFHKQCPCKIVNFINKYVCPDWPTDWWFPHPLSLLRPSCSLRHNNIELAN